MLWDLPKIHFYHHLYLKKLYLSTAFFFLLANKLKNAAYLASSLLKKSHLKKHQYKPVIQITDGTTV